ncbi:unnamed protein product [Scytosiphon promiscuus]
MMEQSPEQKQLQNEVALALKADSAVDTLRTFNTAMDMGVPLRANLLSGVLNQCAKAGLMNDCMRVVMEMKERGMVIEENTFVPIIRGMVSRGNYRGAFDQIKSMVNQGVQPRLRCYEPIIAGACREGDMIFAGEAWEHMEQQGVVPREEQFVNYLCGLSVAGQLWETARSGTLDDKLLKMSYHARNLTMEQAEQLEEHFNAIPVTEPHPETAVFGSDTRSDTASTAPNDAFAIAEAARSAAPLARLVKVAGGHEIDDDSWVREWSSREPLTLTASVAARKEEEGRAAGSSCHACGGPLRAVGLTDGERARIRETLFGLAGLQVKKHARSRHTKLLKRKRSKERQQQQQQQGGAGSGGDAGDDGDENSPFFSFTDEDQKEQLQIFVDWLHAQRADGKTYTAVIDSANVAYHKGNAFHFSLPQVDLMVHALEAKGERPLVVIAEKYIDRVGDLYDNTMPTRGSFRYMSNPLNKAIVKRWRAKSQLYECSDEASDDWYWMFAAVAFDDIPMTVISNDRTRDHRMSLAETVPYLRWRTTQLAQFELTYALGPSMGKGSNAGWPKNPPQVAIQPPPAFTRDVQQSEEGCWHVPAGADDEWLCIDVQRGLRMGLDRLTPRAGKKPLLQSAEISAYEGHQAIASERGVPRVSGDALAAEEEDKLSEVGGLLQSMRVKKQHARAFRYSTQGTVEEAAMAAKQAAARAKAEAAAADALTAEALSAELRLTTGLSDGAGPRDPSPRKHSAENGDAVRQQQRPPPVEGLRRRVSDSGATATGVAPASTVRRVPTPPQGARRRPGSTPVGRHGASAPAAVGGRRSEIRDRGTVPLNGERGGEAVVLARKEGSLPASRGLEHGVGGEGSARELEAGVGNVGRGDAEMEQRQQEEHWASMTVVALKDELRQRGLKVSGKKAELVERLVQG